MPRKESEAVPEGIGLIPMLDGITLKELRQVISKTKDEAFNEIKKDLRSMNQRLASLEHDARQSRLTMEADGPADTKTRERTEGAATLVQAMHEDSFSVYRVDPYPMCSTSLGVKVEPPALPCRDEVGVENGAAAPKSFLSPLEMRTTTAADGLLPTGKASTATITLSMTQLFGSA